MIGFLEKDTPVSTYQPSEAVRKLTSKVKKDYQTGMDILEKQWVELNNRSIIEDENRGQLMFNAFVDTSVEDPNEAWKWRGTRSMARNKGIAMHAQLTANYILPLFTAQNENDEVDRDFSEVMRDIIEWMASPTNSNYQSSFLQIVFAMETNPVTYLGAEYCEVYQKIREKKGEGYTTKEILDEVLSGFKAPIYSSTQVLIMNAFERNIQKQRAIIKRRFCDKSELEAKYGNHENWQYVQSGIKSIYNDEEDLFYDIKDDEHTDLVAEETYLNRREDLEVCFVNGIYMGAANIEDNPIKHRDNRNAPKYNVIPFGFHRIGEHFFYYKSMMNAMAWDNMLYDSMSEIVMNRAMLEVEMPIAVSGSDNIDSEVIFPNSVVTLKSADAKIQQLVPNSNMVAGFEALRETEKSISEGSVNETLSGNLPEASQKAFSVAQAQNNSRKLIGGVAKSLAESVIQYGDLMKDIAINHITVPQVEELIGGSMKLKYRSFILDNVSIGGKTANKTIKFDNELIGASMTEEEKDRESLKMLDGKDYREVKDSIRRVNPELFAKFKYMSKVDTEEIFAKNQEYWQPVLTNLYGMLRADPLIDAEALLKRLTYSYFQSGGDDLIKKQPLMPELGQGEEAEGEGDQFGTQHQARQLAGASNVL